MTLITDTFTVTLEGTMQDDGTALVSRKWQDITDELYGCYAVGQSVQTGLQYKAPSAEDLQTMPVQILKFLLVGAFVLGFWALAVKLGGGSVGKKDAFVIVLVIIAIIMAWNPLIKPILGATDLNTLTFNIGQKLGILTP